MSILGENFVKLVGKITYKNIQEYNGYPSFKCKLAVPIREEFQYIKVDCWGDLATSLGELPNGTWIKVYGSISESSFDTKCRYCQGSSRAYWTSVTINNYVVLQGGM
jgi:hypothetical protein